MYLVNSTYNVTYYDLFDTSLISYILQFWGKLHINDLLSESGSISKEENVLQNSPAFFLSFLKTISKCSDFIK